MAATNRAGPNNVTIQTVAYLFSKMKWSMASEVRWGRSPERRTHDGRAESVPMRLVRRVLASINSSGRRSALFSKKSRIDADGHGTKWQPGSEVRSKKKIPLGREVFLVVDPAKRAGFTS